MGFRPRGTARPGDPGDLPERMPLCGYGGNGRTQRSGAKRSVVRQLVRASRRRSRGHAAEGLRRLALLYRAHPHAMEAARGLPEKSARIRRGLHRRARSALGRGTDRPRDRHSRAPALLDGQGAARSFGAIAAALHRAARHIRVALAGAAEPDRGLGGAASSHRRQHAFGRRSRLPRRYAANRYKAVFCLDRFRARRAGRLAQRPQALKTRSNRPPPFPTCARARGANCGSIIFRSTACRSRAGAAPAPEFAGRPHRRFPSGLWRHRNRSQS